MKIVVLDGHTLNPGDLSWQELRSLGDCEIHDRTASAEVLARAANAEIVLTNKTVLTRDLIAALPRLRYIGVLATGTNVVDLAAARERGIPVTNVPAYATPSVAQLTFAFLLELTLHVGHHAQTVREGRWTRSEDFCYWDRPLVELAGLTLGIVGFGSIGRAVAGIARAFGMNVLVNDCRRPPALPPDLAFVDLETLFRQSDVVSLHCPLTEETRHLVNAERLAWMKPTAFLLNTGRGPLVDEAALAAALNSGRIAGAGLDVLSAEPPPPDNPLLGAKNCLITPHIAWATAAARERLMNVAVENVRAFLAGRSQNVVN
jgi:glycerate dehydrogenase